MNQKTKTKIVTRKATRLPEPVADLNSDSGSESLAAERGIRVFGVAVASLVMLWLSFPPVGLSWLAWIAPFPLVWLVQIERLPGRRPYWQLFHAGCLYWLGTFYFIPIPHPLLWIGWVLVSVYMAIYTPMFVAVTRALVRQIGVPALLAVPIVWTGIEWIRCNFASGMAMVCLSHTQYKNPMVIQVADLFGAYTLTFAMLVVVVGFTALLRGGASLFKTRAGTKSPDVRRSSLKRHGVVFAASCVTMVAVLFYGRFRLEEPIQYKSDSSLNIGLIQTSDDVEFDITLEERLVQLSETFRLTREARSQFSDLDLIVWPESGFSPYSDLISDINDEQTVEAFANLRTRVWSNATGYPETFATPIPLLTGGGTRDPANGRVFGSAFLIGDDGQIENRYFKNHLVMFGEYVPFADWFPLIKKLSPIGGGISPGTQFEIMTRNNVNLAPSICFETTVPHLIRRQVNSLADSGNEPDVLVNMTNDGWFYGTSCLDLHLACNVFRAVEMRKPHLVCANTGISADIDSCGRLRQTGPRRKPEVIRANVRSIDRTSLYRRVGDFVPMLFAGIVLLTGIIGWLRR